LKAKSLKERFNVVELVSDPISSNSIFATTTFMRHSYDPGGGVRAEWSDPRGSRLVT